MRNQNSQNSSAISGYAKVKIAAEYAGVSERTFRGWLKGGLNFVRMPSGMILVRYTDIDDFLSQYFAKVNEVERIVNEIERERRS